MHRKDKSRTFLVLLVLGIVLALTAVVTGPGAYRRYKLWEAKQLIAQIRNQDLPSTNYTAAMKHLRLAHGFGPLLPEVMSRNPGEVAPGVVPA